MCGSKEETAKPTNSINGDLSDPLLGKKPPINYLSGSSKEEDNLDIAESPEAIQDDPHRRKSLDATVIIVQTAPPTHHMEGARSSHKIDGRKDHMGANPRRDFESVDECIEKPAPESEDLLTLIRRKKFEEAAETIGRNPTLLNISNVCIEALKATDKDFTLYVINKAIEMQGSDISRFNEEFIRVLKNTRYSSHEDPVNSLLSLNVLLKNIANSNPDLESNISFLALHLLGKSEVQNNVNIDSPIGPQSKTCTTSLAAAYDQSNFLEILFSYTEKESIEIGRIYMKRCLVTCLKKTALNNEAISTIAKHNFTTVADVLHDCKHGTNANQYSHEEGFKLINSIYKTKELTDNIKNYSHVMRYAHDLFNKIVTQPTRDDASVSKWVDLISKMLTSDNVIALFEQLSESGIDVTSSIDTWKTYCPKDTRNILIKAREFGEFCEVNEISLPTSFHPLTFACPIGSDAITAGTRSVVSTATLTPTFDLMTIASNPGTIGEEEEEELKSQPSACSNTPEPDAACHSTGSSKDDEVSALGETGETGYNTDAE